MNNTDFKYSYIDTREGWQRLAEKLTAAEWIAVDTEADSLHHYYEKVCLIQLTASGENFILDPLAGFDLSEFVELLAGKNLILHGADYDLRMLLAGYGFRPRGEVFDTGIAAQLLGYQRLGLAALVEDLLGVTLNKGGQKFNWSRRPLPEDKITYAVNDTRFLEPLADILQRRLEELDREEWARESCQALVQSTGQPRAAKEPDRVWRIKGLKDLGREELSLVRALWHWREQEAESVDLPPFKVLGNQPLITLASWLCRHPGLSLDRGPKLPRNCLGARLDHLVRAIAEAREIPPELWPAHPRRQPPPRPVPGEYERYELLRERIACQARELGLTPSVLAPQRALRAISREEPSTVEEIMQVGELTTWQARLVGEDLVQAGS